MNDRDYHINLRQELCAIEQKMKKREIKILRYFSWSINKIHIFDIKQ